MACSTVWVIPLPSRFNGMLGLAALVQVCATMPDNLTALEYQAKFKPF
jgi:hypothetical protein